MISTEQSNTKLSE